MYESENTFLCRCYVGSGEVLAAQGYLASRLRTTFLYYVETINS